MASFLAKSTCSYCNKSFSDPSNRNKHMKKIHNHIFTKTTIKHILCPLCESDVALDTYEKLNHHLQEKHQVSVDILTLNFSSQTEYEQWKEMEKIERNYFIYKTKQGTNFKEVYFICNRSNTVGFQSKCKIRTEKAEGSIKIRGVCSSRLCVKMFKNGEVLVKYCKTHVGHKEEIRSQRLTKKEQNSIVTKLKQGINVDRIIEDARKLNSSKLERIHMLSKRYVTYLSQKYYQKKRHPNDMAATIMKVNEWNSNGKNYAFFFKPPGESHASLGVADFALGFMNSVMEEKLKNFENIICMDGTHCTNKNRLDLTTILVKDDRNAGFPVAFCLSNRQDQLVQEIFLGELKKKIGKNIEAKYFMSDDDPKYYNAWIKVMDFKPRRLLCSWHVIKNWNVQGRSKIVDQDIKKSMKSDMKRIMNQTNIETFEQLKEEYFKKLQTATEYEFLNYLKKYYFQNKERVSMWAHCFRINAGINTNMSIESLNNFLKTNQLKRRSNITVESLLDSLQNLLNNKMWQRILNIERPNSQNYQNKIIIRAHKTAESMDKNLVREVGFGEYEVKSSKGNNLYYVMYNELCEKECRTMFCQICKICIHKYKCDCPQYAVKTTICKHVHLVCLYERARGTNCVLDEVKQSTLQIEAFHKEEIKTFITERENLEDSELSREDCRKIEDQNIMNYLNNLDDEAHQRIIKKFNEIINQEERNNKLSKKRKIEKQSYFPTKKRKAML